MTQFSYFAIDWERTLAPENTRNLVYINEIITKGTKTGSRTVFPLYPEWVKLFDLKNHKPLVSNGNFESRSGMISRSFRNNGINFPPYNLRHRLALRGLEMGLSVKWMSKTMDHSPEEHQETYQQWISTEDLEVTYDTAIARYEHRLAEKTEIERVREQNTHLSQNYDTLKLESENLAAGNRQLLNDNLHLVERVGELEAENGELKAQQAQNPETVPTEWFEPFFNLVKVLFLFLRSFLDLIKENRVLKVKVEELEVQLQGEREYRKSDRRKRVDRQLGDILDNSSLVPANESTSNEQGIKTVTEVIPVMNRKQLAERLKVSPSTLTQAKKRSLAAASASDFHTWSKTKDPQGLGWRILSNNLYASDNTF